MKPYLAHSAKADIKAQLYADHVNNVMKLSGRFADDTARYASRLASLLVSAANSAALYHDLGKLDEKNQRVLSGEISAKILPITHWDAGAAYLNKYSNNSNAAYWAAMAASSHHKGLPYLLDELNRGESAFRDIDSKSRTDNLLQTYIDAHNSAISPGRHNFISNPEDCTDYAMFSRILLSCLADADHTDTAIHYGAPEFSDYKPLRADERLEALNSYVKGLNAGKAKLDKRDKLRAKMYKECANANIDAGISACDGPVGSGKTTAVMAHMLAQAKRRGLRRVFLILPYTSIITQAVSVYRKACVLPGEDPREIVAEIHSRADFETETMRRLTALWRAPIIVTTAVGFFETLASNRPSALRRLHELPGSAIFIDEAHAAAPVHLLPIIWKWMRAFSEEWSCYWTLSSGSLSRFWDIEDIIEKKMRIEVPDIVSKKTRDELAKYEAGRITYKGDTKPKLLDDIIEEIHDRKGPVIAVFNTVQNAAVSAKMYAEKYGRDCVEHLSTALTSRDRKVTIERILKRLADKNDNDWVLMATSCVEAGMDFSFKTGHREICSFTSLIQIAGRVNRNGETKGAYVESFCLKQDGKINANPSVKNSAEVLKYFIKNGKEIKPELSSEALRQEIIEYGQKNKTQQKNKTSDEETLLHAETYCNFPKVNDNFHIIDNDTHPAVADPELIAKIKEGKADWTDFQDNVIQLSELKINEFRLEKLGEKSGDDLYIWDRGYDDFLGYMTNLV